MQSILYVIDALRADHLSCYGYDRNTSPNIDGLAKDSIVFTNTHSQSTWTRASAGAILTGLYPPASGVETMYDDLPSKITTLPEFLSSEGVKTLGVSAMGNVSSTFGFDSAFDEFIDVYKHPKLLEDRNVSGSNKLFQKAGEDSEIVNPTSGDLNDFVIPWIKENQNNDFFILIWSIDPHDPYDPLKEFRKYSSDEDKTSVPKYSDLTSAESPSDVQWIKDRYDDLIRQNDYYIGNLCESLKDIGIYNDISFLLTGDHGEAFGEHDVYGHATTPFEEVIHVPLIFKLPENERSSTKSDNLVGHIDIFPTFKRFVNTELPDSLQGRDLFSIHEENSFSRRLYSWTKLRDTSPEYLSMMTEKWKYISVRNPPITDIFSLTFDIGELKTMARALVNKPQSSGQEYLYSKNNGLNENNCVISNNKNVRHDIIEELNEWLDSCDEIGSQIQASKSTIDENTKNQLKEMGYIE